MSLISRLNPTEGIQDFWSEFRRPNPHRWPILGVSILLTTGLMFLVAREGVVGPPVPPDVTYITSFRPDRTDEEIVASNIANQRRKDQIAEILAAREERKKELYRALGRASGMDVDAIEREAEDERRLQEAEVEKLRNQTLGRSVDDTSE